MKNDDPLDDAIEYFIKALPTINGVIFVILIFWEALSPNVLESGNIIFAILYGWLVFIGLIVFVCVLEDRGWL